MLHPKILVRFLYYIGELYVLYLAIIGTWRLGQSTKEQGNTGNILENGRKEEEYDPIKDLSPSKIVAILKWLFDYKNEPEGVKNSVILRKQFNWGLRFIIIAIILQFILYKISIFAN